MKPLLTIQNLGGIPVTGRGFNMGMKHVRCRMSFQNLKLLVCKIDHSVYTPQYDVQRYYFVTRLMKDKSKFAL